VRESSNIEFLKELGINYCYGYKDKTKLNESLEGIDIIIHLAGVVNAASKEEFYESNINITKEIVEASIKNNIKKIISLSTSIATSNSEETYANTKYIAEQIIKESGLNYTVLRPSLVYGKGDKRHIRTLTDFIKKSPFIPIAGNGEYLLHPVYIGDLIFAISKSIDKEEIINKTYTIAGPKPLTFNNIIKTISDALKVKRIKIHIPLPILTLLAGIYEKVAKDPKVTKEQIKRIASDKAYDISSAIKDLDFNPISFKEGIEKTLR
jgi:nucleoside-diphosphate-sugar epimerase